MMKMCLTRKKLLEHASTSVGAPPPLVHPATFAWRDCSQQL